MKSAIQFGSKQIDFYLEYSNRKTLGITVKPDLSVLVKAPVDTSLEKVEEKLRKKASWIIRQQSFFLTFHPKTPAKKFMGGETHLYLGRQYRLSIVQTKLESVKLKGKFIEVATIDKLRVRQLVNDWYLGNAKIKVQINSPTNYRQIQNL
jgi:predicted metal-dependent hydrolase